MNSTSIDFKVLFNEDEFIAGRKYQAELDLKALEQYWASVYKFPLYQNWIFFDGMKLALQKAREGLDEK